MYTKTEIVQIFNECKNMTELFKAIKIFWYLTEEGDMIRSSFLYLTAQTRFRQLIIKR